MTAYGFKDRFVDAIREGRKRQTVRAPRLGRQRHARPGELLQLYRNWRQPGMAKIIPDPVCRAVVQVTISQEGVFCAGETPALVATGVADYGWRRASAALPRLITLDSFARADGFADAGDMLRFFAAAHPLPFTGVCILW